MPENELVRTSLTISDETNQKLKAYAQKQGLTLNGAINTLVNNGLDDWLLRRRKIGLDNDFLNKINSSRHVFSQERVTEVLDQFLNDPVSHLLRLSGTTNSGRTTFTIQLADRLYRNNKNVTYISMERANPKIAGIDITMQPYLPNSIQQSSNKMLQDRFLESSMEYQIKSKKLICWRIENISDIAEIFAKIKDHNPEVIIIDNSGSADFTPGTIADLKTCANEHQLKIIFAAFAAPDAQLPVDDDIQTVTIKHQIAE